MQFYGVKPPTSHPISMMSSSRIKDLRVEEFEKLLLSIPEPDRTLARSSNIYMLYRTTYIRVNKDRPCVNGVVSREYKAWKASQGGGGGAPYVAAREARHRMGELNRE